MAYRIEFSADADRELSKLDKQNSTRILKFLHQRVAKLGNPRAIGRALQGARFGEFWRYWVGDFRLMCKIEDAVWLLSFSSSEIEKKFIVSGPLHTR